MLLLCVIVVKAGKPRCVQLLLGGVVAAIITITLAARHAVVVELPAWWLRWQSCASSRERAAQE